MAMTGEFDDIRIKLESIGEELADRAMEVLRASLEEGASEMPISEKKLTQARRAVEKAVHLLSPPPSADDWG